MRQFHTGRCKAAAGLTEPRCASERGLATGGGRPAERRFTVGGSGKSVAGCRRTVLAYWKFESISLQRRQQTFGSCSRATRTLADRQSRSATPPKCSWKPHCTMSVFVLMVFCLIGHPGRMPGSGRRRNGEPGRVSFERSGSCCPPARRSSQKETGQGSLRAWPPARRQ
jgi:hypothetical protein